MAVKRKPATRATGTATARKVTAPKAPRAPATPKTKVTPAPIAMTGSGAVRTRAGTVILGPVLPGALPLDAVRGATFGSAVHVLVDALLADGDEAMCFILSVVGDDGVESTSLRAAFDQRFPDSPPGFFAIVMRCMTTAGLVGSGGKRTWPASKTVPGVMLWPNNAPAPVRVYPGSWGASVAAFARYAPGGEVLPWTSMPKEVRDALHHAVERGWAVSDVCPVRGPKYRGIRLAIGL